MQSGRLDSMQGNDIRIKGDTKPNIDRLKTMYDGKLNRVLMRYEFVDPRKARPKQRRLFFALISDIWNWSGQPPEDLKTYFYFRYAIRYGKEISLKDTAPTTVTDATNLLQLVIDFMFEFNVPFKAGYELLPKEENYFLYECCKHRKCLICYRYADIHHVDTVGMGRNRDHLDHTQLHVMPLCRKHHTEIEKIGGKLFGMKYHVPTTGIKLDVKTLKRIGVRGHYQEEKNND